MILIDLYIPSLDKTYDFQMDEKETVGNLIAEIAEMIGSETKSGKGIAAEEFLLCSTEQEQIFQKSRSLQEYGVKNGARLILV